MHSAAWPRLLRWAGLLACCVGLSAALLALHMPGAILLGCMVCAIVFAVRGAALALPRRIFDWGQGVLGILMAQSLHPEALGGVAQHWPSVVVVTLLIFGASNALGWWLMRRQVMPGTTAVWGMAPGAASAMVVMAEEFGADVRLVAFMQYTRVVLVTVVAALVAGAAGIAAEGTEPTIDWLAMGDAPALALTVAFVLAGTWWARRCTVPGGAIVLPLVASVLAQLVFDVSPALPALLLAGAYVSVGLAVGLRFTRAVLRHALRALPQVLLAMFLLIAVGLVSGVGLVLFTGLDPLSAYLATSPGGVDSIAVIAATSSVNTSFVMAMQLARFLVVLVAGPVTSRWLARHAPAPR